MKDTADRKDESTLEVCIEMQIQLLEEMAVEP